MLISEEYRTLNKSLHARSRNFGRGGNKYCTPIMVRFADGSILDYGCGKGKLFQILKKSTKHKVTGYDPAVTRFSADPAPHDYVICTDVLEHIEPECLEDVLAHIASLMNKRGLLIISTTKASKQLPDGRNAHLIIENYEWWERRIEKHFVIEAKAEGQLRKLKNKHDIGLWVRRI